MDAVSPPKRRRDAVATKARILAAAKQCFSEVGYASTGIRDIAAAAGVSYTLLGRYYGSKAGLLEAALIESTNIDPVISIERSKFGEHLAHLLTMTPHNPQTTAMTILATADPDSKDIATRIVDQYVVQPMAEWIGEPNGRARAVAITMMGGGFVTYFKHLPLIETPLDAHHPIVRWLARTFQNIIDNADDWQSIDVMRGFP